MYSEMPPPVKGAVAEFGYFVMISLGIEAGIFAFLKIVIHSFQQVMGAGNLSSQSSEIFREERESNHFLKPTTGAEAANLLGGKKAHWTGTEVMAKRSKNFVTRRSFVRKAGIVTAGSPLGCSVGCGANEFLPVLPCLSNVTPVAPAGAMTYIKASEIGCALDCDLSTGRNKYTGGAATDDARGINAAMAGATASNPITLIRDGTVLISGLFPAGGYWSIAGVGCGTGFFIKAGTNNDGIHNGAPGAGVPSNPGVVTPGIPVPARGSNVSLSNFELNGNRGNGHNGNSTAGMVQGSSAAWYAGINLMNLDNITIENLGNVNTSAYHIRLSNVGNVTVSRCTLYTNGPLRGLRGRGSFANSLHRQAS
jgi:hypothetical protein